MVSDADERTRPLSLPEILFKVSGVLAVVTLGLGMAKQGKYSIPPASHEKVETVVSAVAHIRFVIDEEQRADK